MGAVLQTWTNYANAGGVQGSSIAGGSGVLVSCRIRGFVVTDGDAWWYRIGSKPWSGRFYVSADGFYNNGRKSGSLHGTPFVDGKVTRC